MGNGMFIITTDHAGIPDIVEDCVNGIVMDNTYTVKNVYDKLLDSDNAKIKKSSIVNRNNSKEDYSQQNYINHIRAVFLKRI